MMTTGDPQSTSDGSPESAGGGPRPGGAGWSQRTEYHSERVRAVWGRQPSALHKIAAVVIGVALLGVVILLLTAGLFVGLIVLAVIGAMIGVRLLYLRFIRPSDDTLRRNVRIKHGDGRIRDTGLPYE
jgi:hypothetical protein